MDSRQTIDQLKQIIETQSLLVLADFDLQTFMDTVVERMQALTPATGAVVELADEDDMVYKAASGTVAPYIGLRLPKKDSLSGLCIRDNQIKLSPDTSADPRVNLDACMKVGASSMVVVPLVRGSKTVGVLKVVSKKIDAFSQEDVATLQLMAGLLGGALGQQLEIERRKKLEETLLLRTEELETRNAQLVNVLAELEKQGERLKESNLQAQEATRLKSEFLANMSHEIRTPMNAIVGFTDVLLRSSLSDKHREYLSFIRDAGRGLIALIGDILDFSKIEAGKMAIEFIEFELAQMIEGTAQLMVGQCEAKGLSLEIYIEEGIPQIVLGDPSRIRQILINLIGNAIKFSSRGSIEVRVSREAENTKNSVIARFSVKDQGVGLTGTEIGQLFQPFVQADGSTTRKFGGTGLGLSICKRLVELMGGEIGVSSAKGKGSTFWFTLPLHCPLSQEPVANTQKRTPVVAAKHREHKFRGGLVLLAEDHPANQMVAELQLNELGLSTHIVNNGLEAIDALKKNSYQAILMDCQMPEMDGFEATRVIRKQEGDTGRRVPIIAMTANAMQGDRDACVTAGMDDYIAKPVELEELRRILGRWLPSDGLASEVIDLATTLPPDHPAGNGKPAIDLQGLVGLFGKPSVRKLINVFLADTDKSMNIIDTAVMSHDLASLLATAHKLKGSCDTLRALDLGALSAEMEIKAHGENWQALKDVCRQMKIAYDKVKIESLAFLESEN